MVKAEEKEGKEEVGIEEGGREEGRKEEGGEEKEGEEGKGNESKEYYKLVPPDGGWGWVIVAASGLCNFITIPVMQSFALIFSKRIVELDMSPSDLSTIINVNAAFGMGLGIIAGPMFNYFGIRKIALFGAFSSFIGITTTSWANGFLHILVTYSILNSMGTFLLMSAFSLSVNTYFQERRGYASGMSTTLTGLGPVCMPLIITFLLRTYGTQGTALILGALAAHSIAAALLIQPLKWHMKRVSVPDNKDVEKTTVEDQSHAANAEENMPAPKAEEKKPAPEPESEIDTLSLCAMDTPILIHRQFGSTQQMRKKRKSSGILFNRSLSQNDDELTKRLSRITNENKSQDNINTGSETKIVDDKKYELLSQGAEYNGIEKQVKYSKNEQKVTINVQNLIIEEDKVTINGHKVNINEQENNNHRNYESDDKDYSEEEEEGDTQSRVKKEEAGCDIRRILIKYVVEFFGFDLLLDPHYVVLALGMSLAICAELNFSLFTPLILGDYGFGLQEIATVMSTIGLFDLIFRFLSPFIGGRLGYSNQTMYLISLLMLITARTSLIFFHDYRSALIVSGGLGVAKGFRTVYMGLVIPSYLHVDRLAHGSGIQSALNCLIIVMSIPLMAQVRTRTGSYTFCIVALNCITASTVIMWTIQLLYLRAKQKYYDDDVIIQENELDSKNH